jgi:hypothetical protein
VKSLGSAIDVLLMRQPTGSKPENDDRTTPLTDIAKGSRLLRITDDPFTLAMSLVPPLTDVVGPSSAVSRPGPQGALAMLKQSPKNEPSSDEMEDTMQSELFSDVARLTSFDLRKSLAREAKQVRLTREAQREAQEAFQEPPRSRRSSGSTSVRDEVDA